MQAPKNSRFAKTVTHGCYSPILPITMLKRRPFRKLRGDAFDPSLSLKLDTAAINDIVYKVPWEPLMPGPVGEYIEVVD